MSDPIPAQPAVQDVVDDAVAMHANEPGPLIAVLQTIQSELGWLPPEVTAAVANRLNLSRADVHGVVTFYRDFRGTAPARHRVRICKAEACQSLGGRSLSDAASQRLGIGFGDSTPDGSWELDEVFCLGNCALPPAAEVDGVLYGRVNAAHLSRLIQEKEAQS